MQDDPAAGRPGRRRRRRNGDGPGDADAGDAPGGLSGLVGPGPSRLDSWTAARARDISRPRAEDLEAAERDVVIKHARPRPDPPLPNDIRPVPRPPKASGQGPQASGSGGNSLEDS